MLNAFVQIRRSNRPTIPQTQAGVLRSLPKKPFDFSTAVYPREAWSGDPDYHWLHGGYCISSICEGRFTCSFWRFLRSSSRSIAYPGTLLRSRAALPARPGGQVLSHLLISVQCQGDISF
jgi:hypothetical protein